MQEAFLHYLWKHKKFEALRLKTTQQQAVSIHSVGLHNNDSGPDFFNAKLVIGDQEWAGNVEIHVKSSDWYVHQHEVDTAYDNVILHVVWEDDAVIYRNDNTIIPTLELKYYTSNHLLSNYKQLLKSSSLRWINCEKNFADVDTFVFNNWIERLYFDRLEQKAITIQNLLQKTNYNWEAVLFKILAKSFGLKVNGDAFSSIASSFDFAIFRKLQSNPLQMEALIFGQSKLLHKDCQDPYFLSLSNAYNYLKCKYNICNEGVLPLKFFRLRPPNFPTIRLSQLVSLYANELNLFSKLMAINSIADFYKIFSVKTSKYWETHYSFESKSKSRVKITTKSFIDLLLINAIIPLKYCYSKHIGKAIDEDLINLISDIKSEKNSIINKYNSLKKDVSKSALQSQALLHLKTNYCELNKCLQCAIGNSLLSNN